MLAYVQGASDSLPHPSPGCEVESSVFGIAVRALLQAPFLPHCMVFSPALDHGLSVSAFKGCNSALKAFLFLSAGTSRSPELLRCPRNFWRSGGPVQFCHPVWVVSHAMSFSGSFSWSGDGMSFAFVTGYVVKTRAPPLLLSLRSSMYRPNQWETVISCAGGQVLPGLLGMRIVSDACGSLLPQGVTGRSYQRPLSPSSSGCRCHGCAGSRSRNGLFRVPCARCARAVAPSLLCEELCRHPGGRARVWLSRSSLQDYLGPVAPRFLAAFHRFCVVAAQVLVCSRPVRLDIHYLCLESGPWAARLPRSFSYPPPPSHGMLRLGVRVCLHVLECCLYYFLEILDYIPSESLVPS